MLAIFCGCSQPTEVQAPASPNTQQSRLPNVLFILADTLRADQITKRRNDIALMPNLAEFAAESWDYRAARTQSTWTKPSMASIFTSLYPGVHNVLYGIEGEIRAEKLPQTNVLPPGLETMAEYFAANGYSTGAVQSNANITSHFGFAQGFDSFEVKRFPEFKANEITDYAITAMAELGPPFFFYAHYMDTHAPYTAPDEYVEKIGPLPELSEQDAALLKDYGESYRDRIFFEVGLTTQRKYGNLSKNGEEYVRAKYDASSLHLDAEVSRLIRHVRERYPETIIVFTSDHGEELWEHGSIGHGKTVYEELTRVPLIIHAPGRPPRQIDAPVETIDLLPTCAALLGLPAKSEWQGANIGSAALPADRPVFSSTKMSMSGSNRDLEAVVKEGQKLLVDHKAGVSTLFDLENDPGEASGTVLNSSQHTLTEALAEFVARNKEHPLLQTVSTSTGLTPEQEENLRTMGYVK
ncbi:MAG: sulfatase [Candidatus Hydrogenedentes bacterium]|nr:sulfatase [Candidatus Hydrogenedentota bacterium]